MNNQFIQFEKVLSKANIEFSASFMHGTLTSFAIIDKKPSESKKINLLVDKLDKFDVSQNEALKYIQSLQSHIKESLDCDDFDFSLLIDKESSLAEQIESIKEWVSGFLLGCQKTNLTEQLHDETALEFINDLSEISQLSCSDEELKDEQNAEGYLFEIEEYLRIGTLLIYNALR